MMEVAEREIETRERTSMSAETSTMQTRRSSSYHDRQTAAVLIATNPSSLSCYYCGEQHLSTSCKNVTNPDTHKQLLLKAGRCFVCLKGHFSGDCSSSLKCTSCCGRHHATMCNGSRTMSPSLADTSIPSRQSQQPQASTSTVTQQPRSNTSTISMYGYMRTPVLLQTATTMVYSKNTPAAQVTSRLILDRSSQNSYISAELRDMLKLPLEQSVTVSIKIFGSEAKKVQTCDVGRLGLKSRMGLDLELTSYVVRFICEPLSGWPADIEMFEIKS